MSDREGRFIRRRGSIFLRISSREVSEGLKRLQRVFGSTERARVTLKRIARLPVLPLLLMHCSLCGCSVNIFL